MSPGFKKIIVLATNNLWQSNSGIFNLLNKIDENIKDKFKVYKFDSFGLVKKHSFLRKLKIFFIKKIRNFDFQSDLKKFLKNIRPDIVDLKIENFHLNKSFSKNIKFIGRSHGIFYDINKVQKRNILSFLSNAHKIVLPHRGDVETLKLLDLHLYKKNKNKICIIPSFIENKLNDILTRNIDDIENSYKKNKIVFLGSWSERKGSTYIPEIVRRNFNDNPNTSFLFLGTNVEKKQVLCEFDENEKKKYSDRIKIIKKFNKYHDLKLLLKDVKIGILPSNFEGSPSGLLELMSSSIPIVCYDLPGIRDILKPFETELLVEKKNINKFQIKLNKLISLDKRDFMMLSSKVKSRSENFLESNIFPNYIKLLESL